MSFKEISLDFPRSVILLSGKNGEGKSNLLDLVPYSLFGVTSKGISGNDILHRGEFNSEVVLFFEKGNSRYQVNRFRGKASSNGFIKHGVTFFDVGSEPPQDLSLDTATLTNDLIRRLVRTHPDLLFQLSFISNKVNWRFSGLTDQMRKETLEFILGLTIYDRLILKSKEMLEEKSELMSSVLRKLELLEVEAKEAQLHLEELEAKLRSVMSSERELLFEEIDKLKAELNLAELTLKDRSAQRKAFQEEWEILFRKKSLSERMSNTSLQDAQKAKSKVEVLEKKRARLLENKTCLVCGASLTPENQTKLVAELAFELETCIRSESMLLQKSAVFLQELRILEQKIDGHTFKMREDEILYQEALAKVTSLRTELSLKQKSLQDNSKKTEFIELKLKLQAKLTEKENVIQALKSEKESLSRSVDLMSYVKECFINIRSYMLDSSIEFLNGFLKTLSQELQTFLVSLQSTTSLKSGAQREKISILIDGEENLYKSLSSGEERRVDLMVQLSLREFALRAGVELPFLFLDEVLDTLDPEGIQSILSYILRYFDDTVILTSHNPIVKSSIPVIWHVRKVNGASEIVV